MLCYKKIALSFLLLLSTSISPIFAEDKSDEIENYLLIQNLESYSQSRETSMSSVLQRVGALVLEDKKIAKGGFGIISNNVYVRTEGLNNSMRIDEKDWVGLPHTQNQVVYLNNHQISESIGDFDLDKLVIVIFSPTEIRFIDYPNSRAGKYIRRISTE